VLPASAENIGLVRHALAGVAAALRLDSARVSAIRLAVTEACTNVVRHAYQGGPGPLEVDVRTGAATLEVDVRDRGVGILPRPAEDSLGLGIPLIAALTDRLRIARERDGATVISMAFRR
jgi:anti-sigma regulatory factor (Ser/Thr protein kinase)